MGGPGGRRFPVGPRSGQSRPGSPQRALVLLITHFTEAEDFGHFKERSSHRDPYTRARCIDLPSTSENPTTRAFLNCGSLKVAGPLLIGLIFNRPSTKVVSTWNLMILALTGGQHAWIFFQNVLPNFHIPSSSSPYPPRPIRCQFAL